MDEYENIWKTRAQQHDEECHIRRINNYIVDPSCPRCYPLRDISPDGRTMQKFRLFWNWYQPTFHAATYTRNTVNDFVNILLMEENFYEEGHRAETIEEINQDEILRQIERIQIIIIRIVGSMRYDKKPPVEMDKIVLYISDYTQDVHRLEREGANEE